MIIMKFKPNYPSQSKWDECREEMQKNELAAQEYERKHGFSSEGESDQQRVLKRATKSIKF